MQGFAGKVAVVTGAGSGIGQALAVELGRSGASVAISDVDTDDRCEQPPALSSAIAEHPRTRRRQGAGGIAGWMRLSHARINH